MQGEIQKFMCKQAHIQNDEEKEGSIATKSRDSCEVRTQNGFWLCMHGNLECMSTHTKDGKFEYLLLLLLHSIAVCCFQTLPIPKDMPRFYSDYVWYVAMNVHGSVCVCMLRVRVSVFV